jgi:predicted MFS family arabinose efflux permease
MVAVPRGSMEVAVVILVLTQLMLAIGGGAAVGLPAGDVLTQTRGWGWVMFVNVPIGILVLIGALRHLPELPRQGTSPAPRPRP